MTLELFTQPETGVLVTHLVAQASFCASMVPTAGGPKTTLSQCGILDGLIERNRNALALPLKSILQSDAHNLLQVRTKERNRDA